MTKNLSAIKRNQTSLRNNLLNRAYKSTVKTLMKKTLLEMDSNASSNNDKVKFYIALTYSKIDKAVKKKIISKNSAARKKSILSTKFKSRQKR